MKWLREFCKVLAIWAVCLVTLTVAATFLWPVWGWPPPDSNIIITVVSGGIALLAAYQAKSAYETKSRNDCGLDKDGQPYKTKGEENQ